MKLILFMLMSASLPLFGQQDSDCNWIKKFESNNDVKGQLSFIKKSINQPCSALVVFNGYPLSKDSSTYPFNYPQTFINAVKLEEIDSLVLLKENKAKKLYGTAGKKGIIILTLKKVKMMKRIRRRVIKQLKNKPIN